MRKWRLMIWMAVLSMVLCGAALAYGDDTSGAENMPEAVQRLAAERWPGWEITGWVDPAGVRTASACGFAALHKGESNLLAAFGYKDGQWRCTWHNADALPQRAYGVRLLEGTDGGSTPTFVAQELTCPAVRTSWARRDAASDWLLTGYEVLDTDGETVLERMTVKADSVTYQGWKLDDGRPRTFSGETQRDLRYFSWNAFPKTPEELRAKLTSAPDIPRGGLTAQRIRFTGGKKYDVYTAPDPDAVRGGNGKARVSTNGWIQVFGREDDWVLIQYAIDSGHCRFGYIPDEALPKKAEVPLLELARTPAEAVCAASITDDPLYSTAAVDLLQAGDRVLWLASMGDWAYIEVTDGQKLLRGFVPADCLRLTDGNADRFAAYTSADGETYDLFTITKLHFTPDHQVNAVSGCYERIVMGEDCDEPESAPGSAATYQLAPDFHAMMADSMIGSAMEQTPVTDLYQWYVDAYIGADNYDGHDLVFACDIAENEWENGRYADFWFVTTQIVLNERREIEYMEYVPVPWA